MPRTKANKITSIPLPLKGRGPKRPPINSAEFNIREIAKQMLLLEDHLVDNEKFCEDCIRKHLLMIEALAEESLTMEPDGDWYTSSQNIAKLSRKWMKQFHGRTSNSTIEKEIRKIRKKIVKDVYDK